MFDGCWKLKSVDMTNFKTKNLKMSTVITTGNNLLITKEIKDNELDNLDHII